MTRQNTSFLNTKSFTRREVFTRVLPAGLAATMLGIDAAATPVSAHSLQKSSPEVFWTNLAPGAAGFGDYTMVTSVSTDGRIFYDWWKLGGGGHGWRELEGGGQTDAVPAAALVGPNNDYLFVIVKGREGRLWLNQGNLGRPFVGWQLMS